jgi:hypothetical protein
MKYDQNSLSELLKIKKERAEKYKERRLDEWDENYNLYRNKTTYNRLTQRQSVVIPLMKMGIRTMLKDVDDPPLIYFKEKSGDGQKELFYNEYWVYSARENKLVLKDIVDKKQVFTYGRSFKKLNVVNGRFIFEIVDPYDILVEKTTDPTKVDNTTYFAHTNIYKPLSVIVQNSMFDDEAKKQLVEYFQTQQGSQSAEENSQSMQEKDERLKELGMEELVSEPQFGETFVLLTEHYTLLEDEKLKKPVFYYVVTAQDDFVLFFAPLYQVIGDTPDHYWYDHLPYTSWADDVETTDFWSDGVGDILRPSNKILNSWFSQLVENRTLRNFGMHYYNSTLRNFIPQTFEPVPWGWYPVPGNPDEIIKKVDVPDLSDSLDELSFVMNISERASAVTTTQQGVVSSQKVTLGEIQLALANAKERIQSMATYYIEDWLDFGQKYIKFLEAAGENIDAVKVEKKGRLTNKIYEREISPKDWKSEAGYTVEVKNISRDMSATLDQLQKLGYAKSVMPENQALTEIIKQKSLEFADLDAKEVEKVLQEEKQKQEAAQSQPQPQLPEQAQPTVQQPELDQQLPINQMV